MRRLLPILVAFSSLPSLARASAPDVFGFGSDESGVGGASAARVHDFSAGYYNPAGLTRVERPEASFGLLGFGSQLVAGDRVRPIAEPLGFVIGAATPVPFGGALADRVFVGIGLYLLPDAIVRVISRPPDEPFFPYYDNRTQRLVVLPTLAVKLWKGLSAGIAINYLAGLGGYVQASEGGARAVEPRVDEAIFATFHLNAGLQWRSPRDRLAFGIAYRQQFSVPFKTVTNNVVAGQPLDLSVDAEGLFNPHQLVAGAAARPTPWLQLSLDATYSLWSLWRGPYVTVTSVLPIAGPLDAPVPVLKYADTIALRVGGEATRALGKNVDGKLRAGYGFETSPIPDQPGVTNLLDAPKHFLSLGAGLVVTAARARVRLDAHGQLQVMQPRTLTKVVSTDKTPVDPAVALRNEQPDQPGIHISNPGYPTITGSGFVWAAGITLTVQR